MTFTSGFMRFRSGTASPMVSLPVIMLTRVWVMAFLASSALAQPSAPPLVKDGMAAGAPTSLASAKPMPTKQPPAAPVRSGWSLLNPDQQRALQPLAQSWGSLSDGQQRKWLEISRNYPSLSDADKVRMHSRMSAWVALSPRERAEARLNFAATNELSKELSPQEKQAKWEAYQSLSAEEKGKLAKAGVRPPVGAALPTRPVPPQKLATLPPTDAAAKAPKIALPPVAVGQQPVAAE